MIIELLFSTFAFAVEPTNPMTLCDRFIAPDMRKACESRMGKIEPDWYLATICEKQFDDVNFFTCLELSKKANFSPAKLVKCDSSGFSDSERMGCLRDIADNSTSRDIFQPSSIPSAKTKKKNPRVSK